MDESLLGLSIEAGGSIAQKICPDRNDPRIWDTAKAKLLNIQLVNSAHFELITGMIAPKTPITYETYAKSGLPFYNIYNEQPTKISGKFDAIQTIAEKEARVGYAVGFDFDPLRPALCSRCKTNFIDSLYVLDLQVKEDQH